MLWIRSKFSTPKPNQHRWWNWVLYKTQPTSYRFEAPSSRYSITKSSVFLQIQTVWNYFEVRFLLQGPFGMVSFWGVTVSTNTKFEPFLKSISYILHIRNMHCTYVHMLYVIFQFEYIERKYDGDNDVSVYLLTSKIQISSAAWSWLAAKVPSPPASLDLPTALKGFIVSPVVNFLRCLVREFWRGFNMLQW